MILILDYGMGNLRSVQKALEKLGHAAVIAASPEGLAAAVSAGGGGDGPTAAILPGVGAFADGMALLRERGWDAWLGDWVAGGRPVLGVCLGMQLLFESSEEDAAWADEPVPGLGLLAGRVRRFDDRGGTVKVPHMGWNALRLAPRGGAVDPLLAGLGEGSHVYFVHGYYCEPADASAVIATSDYPEPFCAAVRSPDPACRVWATQFHPEKSQSVGLRILDNFASTAIAAAR